MRRTALLCLPVALSLAACGGETREEEVSTPSTSSSAASSTASTPSPTPTAAVDRVASANCILAGLTYLPLRNALESGTGIEFAVQVAADGPDFDAATTDAGGSVDLALAELNYELAIANASALTGNLDPAPLLPALDAVDSACADF